MTIAAAVTAATLGAAAPDRGDAGEPAAVPALTVDLGASEGPLLYGANGALYGLSDDGVPSDAILAPLKLSTITQKPEGGAQHPNGDALTVSDSFFRNGGGDIYVMMQDIYAEWPYEDLGLDDYLPKVDSIIEEIAAHPRADRFVVVPFNEPDQIWYRLDVADTAQYERNRDRFLADWSTVHDRIRAISPTLRIAGPNEARYDRRFLPDFYRYAYDHDVLPDVTTWHELSPDSLRDFQGNHDHYRALEREIGFGPLPVNIDEYANRRDLSVPGQLVQWVGMFERNKVFANQAYWDMAGNLDGNVVRDNIPNGGWWFFRWYAALTGDTVRVTPPSPDTIDTLQGLASLDTAKRQAQALLGGADGPADVVFEQVDPALFGDRVSVTVAETRWSGYEGAHPAPRVIGRATAPVGAAGTVTVSLTGLERMSAYRVVLTPAGADTPDQPAEQWRGTYEAEDARITGGEIYTHGTVANANGYATSGTRDVGSLNREDSQVEFTVEVPADGTYDLTVFHGNQSDAPATQLLTVDGGEPAPVTYPATLNRTYRGTVTVPLTLSAGRHTLTLAKGDGEVTLDKIELTEAAEPFTAYEATLADTTGAPGYDYASAAGTGTGALVLDGAADGAVFDVYAPRDGYYRLTPRHTGEGMVTLEAHGERFTAPAGQEQRVLLAAGNNRITATAAGHVALAALEVAGAGERTGLATHQAADARLAGTTELAASPHASEGTYLRWLGDGADNTAAFTVRAEQAGPHLLIVHYANDERADNGHAYNSDVISRILDIQVDGATTSATFRNSYGWQNFWGKAVPIELSAGTHTLTLSNPTAHAPDIDRLELAPVRG
ncbi:CBM35 domain-containing protein [Streptomyces xiamenensis]|uniref:CBM35 domain-containing protein n=1 Tax=Streptomyces xiamenensis TaxID=408015 RepID=UPI003443E94C